MTPRSFSRCRLTMPGILFLLLVRPAYHLSISFVSFRNRGNILAGHTIRIICFWRNGQRNLWR